MGEEITRGSKIQSVGEYELILERDGSRNLFKEAYFPAYIPSRKGGDKISLEPFEVCWTFGKRREEGVARGDVCSIDHGRLCEAIIEAGKRGDYAAEPIKGYEQCYAQVVDPNQTVADRRKELLGDPSLGYPLEYFNLIACGGLPCLDSMKIQHPGEEFDFPYTVESMKKARITPGKPNLVFDYPGAVEAQGIDLENYTWQDMVSGKKSKEPWQWQLVRVYPDGNGTKYFYPPVDAAPGTLLQDMVLIHAGRGINPYRPDKYAIMVVGGRGGSTALGSLVVDRDPKLSKIKGGIRFLEEFDRVVEDRPDSSTGIKMAFSDYLEKGQAVTIKDMVEVLYV